MMTIRPDEAVVLVVEDNFQNDVLMACLLAYLGVTECVWKASGGQLLESLESVSDVDLILMNNLLPDSDGYTVLDRLRGGPGLKDALAVAVTADSSVDNLRRAEKSGFDGFITKPLKPDFFPLQIRRVLKGERVWDGA